MVLPDYRILADALTVALRRGMRLSRAAARRWRNRNLKRELNVISIIVANMMPNAVLTRCQHVDSCAS